MSVLGNINRGLAITLDFRIAWVCGSQSIVSMFSSFQAYCICYKHYWRMGRSLAEV
jgi:hypothetical protein